MTQELKQPIAFIETTIVPRERATQTETVASNTHTKIGDKEYLETTMKEGDMDKTLSDRHAERLNKARESELLDSETRAIVRTEQYQPPTPARIGVYFQSIDGRQNGN